MLEQQDHWDAVGSSAAEAARLIALLAREGIDDLAKLRVMQFLWRTPSVVGDAAFFARILGFHSAAFTQRLLDELAEAGVLARWQHEGGVPRYGLPVDEQGCPALGWLRYQIEGSPALPRVVRMLAQRSLARVRRAAAQQRRARGRILEPAQ